MIWLLPLFGGLFFFDSFRTAMGYPPVWLLRSSVILNSLVPNLSLFAAGVAAWTGSRDGRRHTRELVGTGARPRWSTALASFAATTLWTLAAFFGCVAVLYGVTATQASWGGPPWWPVATGATVLMAFCALGFAAGMLIPGRFTAPLTALGSFLVLIGAYRVVLNEPHPTFALLSPDSWVPRVDAGVFFPYLPDLDIVQIMFFAGIAVAVLGGLGLVTASGSRVVWRAAAVVTAVGLAAAAAGFGLAGTARVEDNGVVIPAVHDAASDRPIAYTPDCQHVAIPVCIHPAFRAFLPDLAAFLNPLLRLFAGLPGAPVRVEQSRSTPGWMVAATASLSGSPPVLHLAISDLASQPGSPGSRSDGPSYLDVDGALVGALIGGGSGGATPGEQLGDPAQAAVEAALLNKVAYVKSFPGPQRAMVDAAQRFEALAPSVQRGWLATHLVALRSGGVRLAQVP
jgi:hypothetical protein